MKNVKNLSNWLKLNSRIQNFDSDGAKWKVILSPAHQELKK